MDSEDRQELAGQLVWLAGEDDAEGARVIIESAPELLNGVCAFGETALGYWAIKQCADAVTLLLDLGADVNATNDVGGTPLMACAGRGDLDMAKLLLERGAIRTTRSILGIARSSGRLTLTTRKWRRCFLRATQTRTFATRSAPARWTCSRICGWTRVLGGCCTEIHGAGTGARKN